MSISDEKEAELVSRFTSHIADTKTVAQMANIRRMCRGLARQIETDCPDCREKQTALTQLSFVMMSANSAIVQVCPINKAELP